MPRLLRHVILDGSKLVPIQNGLIRTTLNSAGSGQARDRSGDYIAQRDSDFADRLRSVGD